jgi:hypothetical protein
MLYKPTNTRIAKALLLVQSHALAFRSLAQAAMPYTQTRINKLTTERFPTDAMKQSSASVMDSAKDA